MLKMSRKGVTADDSESLGYADRILAIGFPIAKKTCHQELLVEHGWQSI